MGEAVKKIPIPIEGLVRSTDDGQLVQLIVELSDDLKEERDAFSGFLLRVMTIRGVRRGQLKEVFGSKAVNEWLDGSHFRYPMYPDAEAVHELARLLDVEAEAIQLEVNRGIEAVHIDVGRAFMKLTDVLDRSNAAIHEYIDRTILNETVVSYT